MDKTHQFYCTKNQLFILSVSSNSLFRYSLQSLINNKIEVQSIINDVPIFVLPEQNENIIFAKCFENFFVLGIQQTKTQTNIIRIWNEKLDSTEELMLQGEKFYKMEQLEEKFYSNPILLLFSNSFLLEKSLEVIDLNTMIQKSKPHIFEKFQIYNNVVSFENFELRIFEQNHFLFKSKKLLISFITADNGDFLLYEKFLLKNGFSVVHYKSKNPEFDGTIEAIDYIEKNIDYPISIIIDKPEHLLKFLKNGLKFPKVENIIISNMEYNFELESFVLENSMTGVFPPGCKILFLNQREYKSSLYTRKLLAKFREDDFTNEFFFLEYETKYPYKIGSVIINFLK